MVIKKRVNPEKIFFKFKCLDCKGIIEQPIDEAHQVGEPFCPICESDNVEYMSTFMLVKDESSSPSKMRTKNTLNATQRASKKDKAMSR